MKCYKIYLNPNFDIQEINKKVNNFLFSVKQDYLYQHWDISFDAIFDKLQIFCDYNYHQYFRCCYNIEIEYQGYTAYIHDFLINFGEFPENVIVINYIPFASFEFITRNITLGDKLKTLKELME